MKKRVYIFALILLALMCVVFGCQAPAQNAPAATSVPAPEPTSTAEPEPEDVPEPWYPEKIGQLKDEPWFSDFLASLDAVGVPMLRLTDIAEENGELFFSYDSHAFIAEINGDKVSRIICNGKCIYDPAENVREPFFVASAQTQKIDLIKEAITEKLKTEHEAVPDWTEISVYIDGLSWRVEGSAQDASDEETEPLGYVCELTEIPGAAEYAPSFEVVSFKLG